MSQVRKEPRFRWASRGAMMVLTGAVVAMSAPAFAQDRALVIVNSSYRDISTFDAGASGTLVADALRDAGFEVTLLEDATTGGVLAALRTLGANPDQDASAVLYYSGFVRQARGRNYLIARDAKPSAPFDFITQGVGIDNVMRALADGAGRMQFAIIDGAYPDPTLDALPALEPGQAAMNAGPSQVIVLGSPVGEVLPDASTVESVAASFAGALVGADGPVSAMLSDFENRLFATTERRVAISIGGDGGASLVSPEGVAVLDRVDPAEIESAIATEPSDDPEPDNVGGGTFQQAPVTQSETEAEGEAAETPAAEDPDGLVLADLSDRADRERVQFALKTLGLYPGTIDGVHGQVTRRGISTFQRLRGFPVTGELTKAQLALLYELAEQ